MIYPWQKALWQQFIQYLDHKRLVHAVLISGPSAIGKLDFCLACIQHLNCTDPTDREYPCGTCESCHLTKVGTHPDVRLINAEKSEGTERTEQIKVDDIRKISQFMSLSGKHGRYKIVCINHAERMNTNAANALLKTLEEPPPGSILFLVSDRTDSLPATVRSRCQNWKFSTPDSEPALQWLQEKAENPHWENLLAASGGRPLLAWELHDSGQAEIRTAFFQHLNEFLLGRESVTELSAKFQHESPERILSWLQTWCGDSIRYHFLKRSNSLENQDIFKSLQGVAEQMDLQSLFSCMDRLTESRYFASTPLNRRLLVEDMLLQCQQSLRYLSPQAQEIV